MTINNAIKETDRLKHNIHTDAEKVKWLERIDQMLYRTVIQTHEGDEDIALPSYDPDVVDMDTALLATEPHDQMYIYWLMAQIDLANADIDQYNVQITLFNDELTQYKAAYTKSHMPKSMGKRFLF